MFDQTICLIQFNTVNMKCEHLETEVMTINIPKIGTRIITNLQPKLNFLQ